MTPHTRRVQELTGQDEPGADRIVEAMEREGPGPLDALSGIEFANLALRVSTPGRAPAPADLPERADALIDLLDRLTAERGSYRRLSMQMHADAQARVIAEQAGPDQVLIRGVRALVPTLGPDATVGYRLHRARDLDVEEHAANADRQIGEIRERDTVGRSFDRRVESEAGRLIGVAPVVINSIESKLETGLLAPRPALSELSELEAGIVLRWALVGLEAARSSLSCHLD